MLGMGWSPEATLLVVGLFAGLTGGLLGVGGGIVMIPAMIIFLGNAYGPNSLHVYKLAAITTSMVLSLPAAARHHRAGAVVYRMVPAIAISSVAGVVAGVLVASLFVGPYTPILRRTFGVFIELAVVSNVYQEIRALRGETHLRKCSPMPHRWAIIGPLIGTPAGFVAGLLGVGGGIWAVPAQRQLLGIRIRNAIANSSVVIICIAVVTSIVLSIAISKIPGDEVLHPAQGWWLALWLAPGAIGGAWIGAGLTHRIPTTTLRYAFQVLLMITGVRLIFF